MKKLILILAFLSIISVFGQSREITGTVLTKGDEGPLPGAAVIIKGTNTGTQTDFDGHFIIMVPDSLNTLTFSCLGHKSAKYILKEENNIIVHLKEDCTICYFDYQDLKISYFGGLKNAPNGFLLDITIPLPIRLDGPLQVKYGYQTNFKENKQHYFEAGFPHFFADCGFSADMAFIHTNIENGPTAFDYKDQRIEFGAEIDFGSIDHLKLFAGYGTSQLRELNNVTSYNGYEIGVGKYFRYGIEAYAKATYWSNFWQHQLGLDWNYRRYSLLLQYNKIDAYDEFQLGIGFKIY